MKKDNKENKDALVYLLDKYIREQNRYNLGVLICCLSKAEVWVPMNLIISEEDKQGLINSKAGDIYSTEDIMRMIPDYLTNDGKEYFPIFSKLEEVPEDYSKKVSWIQLPMMKCINMVKSKDNIEDMILNAYSHKFVISKEFIGAIETISKLEAEHPEVIEN